MNHSPSCSIIAVNSLCIAADSTSVLCRGLILVLNPPHGTRETESPDFISMLMFEPHYTTRLIEIGETDVASRLDEFRTFLGEPAAAITAV